MEPLDRRRLLGILAALAATPILAGENALLDEVPSEESAAPRVQPPDLSIKRRG